MPDLQIQVLGDFRLTSDGKPVMALNTPRLQALLTYLALFHKAPQSRQQLAFHFWPDSTDSQARTNLRNLLHQLRQALPGADRYLKSDRHTVQWNPDSSFSLDVAAFENAIAQARAAADPTEVQAALRKAVDLYRGDLLPACYDDWILAERERLREANLRALESLVRLAEAQRDYPQAITHARRLLRLDPLHEAIYRRLMRLHALNQDPAGALRTYHTCVTVLAKELDVAPSPETQAAYDRLLNLEDQPQEAPLAARLNLVGRQQAWGKLQGLWRRAASTPPRMVLLTGEAGIGKTRLAEELLDWCTRQGYTALSARCYLAEGRLAYAPITEWLQTLLEQEPFRSLDAIWLQEISRLLPELIKRVPELKPPPPLTENWQRQRLHEALVHGVLTIPQPLLLFIDNLHWADHETLEFLHYLLRFDPRTRFLILGTVREGETFPEDPLEILRHELHRRELLSEIPLGRLDRADTTQLARQVFGQPLDPEQEHQLFRETEGNPLFVLEMTRMGALIDGTLTPRLQAVIERRLALLSPQARELAGLAATIGRAFTFDVLAHASRVKEDDLVRALDELWSRRVVLEQGLEAYDFSHERLREVAYQAQSAARRRLNHRRVAAALAKIHQSDRDLVSGQIAAHHAAAGNPVQAIKSYQLAAEAARRLYANQEAIKHYAKILEILKTHPDALEMDENQVLSKTHVSLGDLQVLVGQIEQALDHYRKAKTLLPKSDVLRRAHIEWLIGTTWHNAYQFDKALTHLQQAVTLLEAAEEQSPEWWRLWIHNQQAQIWVYYRLSDLQAMQALIDKLSPLVQAHGSSEQRVEYYAFLVANNNLQNRFVVSAQDIEYAKARVEAAQDQGSDLIIAQARFSLGFELLWFGELKKAEEQLRFASQFFSKVGYRLMESRCLTYLATLMRLKGDVAAMDEPNQRNREILQDIYTPDYLGMVQAHEAWQAWRTRDVNQAEILAQKALQTWEGTPHYPFKWAALWPALAVASDRNDLIAAAAFAEAMLAEKQQLQPEPASELLETFIEAQQSSEPSVTRARLDEALKLARQRNYL